VTLNHKGADNKKAIFYPGPIHLFWTTGIYYLYLISKRYEVTLVLENCSIDNEKKIIEVCKHRLKDVFHLETKYNLLRHKYYRETAYNLVGSVNPDIIFINDDQNVFNTYLLRATKKKGCVSICYQTGTMEGKRRYNWGLFCGADACNMADKYKLPYFISLLLTKLIQHSRHIWHYYCAPLLAGERPFTGKSSAYLSKGRSGMRDGDCFVVFSEREKNICISDGLCADKIIILSHPIESVDRSMIEELWNIKNANKTKQDKEKTVLILLPHVENDFCVERETGQIISKERIYESWETIMSSTLNKYPNAIVWLKMHPGANLNSKTTKWLLKDFIRYRNIEIVSNDVDGMQYAVNADIIIGETSTLLYTVSRAFEDKDVISFDLLKRRLGDAYKGDRKICYVTDIGEFLSMSFFQPVSPVSENTVSGKDLFSLLERILKVHRKHCRAM
jgi:hypothetical protein